MAQKLLNVSIYYTTQHEPTLTKTILFSVLTTR